MAPQPRDALWGRFRGIAPTRPQRFRRGGDRLHRPHGVGAYASNFVRTFIGSIGTEAHLKVAVGACWKLELLKITGG